MNWDYLLGLVVGVIGNWVIVFAITQIRFPPTSLVGFMSGPPRRFWGVSGPRRWLFTVSFDFARTLAPEWFRLSGYGKVLRKRWEWSRADAAAEAWAFECLAASRGGDLR